MTPAAIILGTQHLRVALQALHFGVAPACHGETALLACQLYCAGARCQSTCQR